MDVQCALASVTENRMMDLHLNYIGDWPFMSNWIYVHNLNQFRTIDCLKGTHFHRTRTYVIFTKSDILLSIELRHFKQPVATATLKNDKFQCAMCSVMVQRNRIIHLHNVIALMSHGTVTTNAWGLGDKWMKDIQTEENSYRIISMNFIHGI